jgi:hypothetical protein
VTASLAVSGRVGRPNFPPVAGGIRIWHRKAGLRSQIPHDDT